MANAMFASRCACNGNHAVRMFAVLHNRRRLRLGAAFLFLLTVSWAWSQTPGQLELSNKGKELMTQGRYAEAIPVYQTLVNQISGNTGLLLNLAMAEAMGGQPKSAIAHCREVLKHDGQSIPALTMLSMSHLQLEQPAQALDPLRRLIQLTPDNVDARGMLAGAEMSLKHFESAAQQYSRLTQLTPTDPKAWYGLGKSYEALAGQRFEQLTKMAPESAYMAVLIGDTRLQRRQFRSAFFFYRQAEKQMPQLPGLHAGLASVYEGTDH